MLEIIFQLIAAFVGTVSFSILFSTPNKYLPQCGLVGALGWGVHLLTLDVTGSSVAAIFAASAILTICSRYLARIYKVTTTLFLISGIFTSFREPAFIIQPTTPLPALERQLFTTV